MNLFIHRHKFLRYKLLFSCVFSFVLGCMLTINTISVDKTCKLEDTDKEFNIMHDSKLKSPELIILILSAPANANKRNTIRQTWLKLSDRGHKSNSDSTFKTKHYFAIGRLGLNNGLIKKINDEQLKYNDILILPMFDSYSNLTYKVLKSFEWLNEHYDFGVTFKYVLKCDDDSFVRLDNLIHELQQLELLYIKSDKPPVTEKVSPYVTVNMPKDFDHVVMSTPDLYWGYFKGNTKIKTVGKWKEDNWILCDYYLPYALGGGYLLSKSLVSFIAQNANYLKLYNSEDVSVGTWLAAVSNVLRIHDSRFDTEWIPRGCQNYYLITHSVTEEQMRVMYKNIIKTNDLCHVEETKRLRYLYDWSLPPSQCCFKTDF